MAAMGESEGFPGVKPERYQEGLRPVPDGGANHVPAYQLLHPPAARQAHLQLPGHQRTVPSGDQNSYPNPVCPFPVMTRSLAPVIQLNVSVDASPMDSLKKIDQPLFQDFWTRFLNSLKALEEKRQRTVYRLTLVKAWSVDELRAYSELVALGRPDFIRVKGVTYCGESPASSLTMANVPWHQEVVSFIKQPTWPTCCPTTLSPANTSTLTAFSSLTPSSGWRRSGGRGSTTSASRIWSGPTRRAGAGRSGLRPPQDTRYQRHSKTKDISGC
ncbi:hypothetical protein NHX12_008400 [Muraenolepis orangiensis]|uniref:tRNA wybutosine-synthesis domain-containing protein n=1 Tax=Muraenolepis orangiensis TaxID=630683 RepID=A0A9Q0DJN8_9TELE|nr:hypothetical protein NHX12_008400 [Muraenolepis orangiensis]